MGQLLFEQNMQLLNSPNLLTINNGSLSFFPFNIRDSISFGTLNFLMGKTNNNVTFTMSVGLYSLTGSTLSLTNSISETFSSTNVVQKFYMSLTATSAAQNITPGTWFLGMLVSTGGNSDLSLNGATINPGNAFPGAFIGGAMTDSTNALPSSYATSNLDITGSNPVSVPLILLTA